MKAKMINEFMRGGDPKRILGLGYGNKPNTTAWKILEFIGSKGEEGAGLKEIQRFILVNLKGWSEDEFERKETYKDWDGNEKNLRSTRGYYATNLYGSNGMFGGGPGLLAKYCHRNANRKWVLDRMPNPKEPLY